MVKSTTCSLSATRAVCSASRARRVLSCAQRHVLGHWLVVCSMGHWLVVCSMGCFGWFADCLEWWERRGVRDDHEKYQRAVEALCTSTTYDFEDASAKLDLSSARQGYAVVWHVGWTTHNPHVQHLRSDCRGFFCDEQRVAEAKLEMLRTSPYARPRWRFFYIWAASCAEHVQKAADLAQALGFKAF